MNKFNNIHINNHSIDYECHENDSILESGLRNGLSMQYMCQNGTCGECSAKLIKGEVVQFKHHDFVLSSNQKQNNEFLMCCNSPISNIDIDVDLIGDVKSIKTQNIDTKVKSIIIANDDLCILTLRTPRSKVLQFMAGQDVELSFEGKTSRYPIASCPCHGIELEFHIRKFDEDEFAGALFSASIKVKSNIKLEGPKGIFVLKEKSDRPMLFIAWDIGFAPIRSLIEHAFSLEMSNPVYLYWAYPEIKGPPYLENHANSWKLILDDYSYTKIACNFNIIDNNYYINIANSIYKSLDIDAVINSDVYISAPAEVIIYLSEMLLETDLNEKHLIASPI